MYLGASLRIVFDFTGKQFFVKQKHCPTDSASYFMQLAAILQALWLCVTDFRLFCRLFLLLISKICKKN